jgi:rhodanese-related sulfurtransferase
MPNRLILQVLIVFALGLVAASVSRSKLDAPPAVVFRRAAVRPRVSAPPESALSEPSGTQAPQTGPTRDEEGRPIILQVTTEQAQALYDGGEAQFVDAQTGEQYREGHIPGAVHLVLTGFSWVSAPGLDSLIPELPVVVYCGGVHCDSSGRVARRLVMLGFEDVRVFEEGLAAWKTAGYPVEAGKEGKDD